MATEACGGEIDNALPAACAVEMIHAYSLVHDDLPAMDDDQLRRGLPTCHVRFDESTAILVGDALIPMAFRALATDLPPEIAAECCRLLAIAAGPTQLVGGQADDLDGEKLLGSDSDTVTDHAASHLADELQDLEQIHARKTGAMLTVSLVLGGVVAKAPARQLELLGIFGKKLGLAFQIVDDLLDWEGDWTKMGKMTRKDQQHGKLTYPCVLGVRESRQLAERLIDEACATVEPFGANAQSLIAMARFVLERNQ